MPPRGRVGRREQLVPHEVDVGHCAVSSSGDQQDAVDLVDLDELDLDALTASGGQVLADVIGADRQLAMAAVGDDCELDAVGAAVVEERLDRGSDRAAGVEDVVDEDARAPLEREVERGSSGRAAAGAAAASPPRTWTSSRWKVMSTVPSATSTPLNSSISRRRRCASETPRVWMPTSATRSSSGFRSTISCAIRGSVRESASASRMTRCADVGAQSCEQGAN